MVDTKKVISHYLNYDYDQGNHIAALVHNELNVLQGANIV